LRAHRLRAVAVATGTSLLLTAGAGLTVGAGAASAATSTVTATGTAATTRAATSTATSVPFKGKSPAKIWALSLAEVKKASGFRARLRGAAAGDIDVVVGRNGSQLTVRTGGSTIQVLRVGSKLWVKGNAAYWKQSGLNAATAKRLAGRWVAVPGTKAIVKSLSPVMTAKGWASLLSDLKPTARVAGKVVGKVPTVGLHGRGSTGYVAAKGKPFPLLVIDDGGATTIAFSGWNTKVTFKAPSPQLVAR
jgi:hypothetical protein